MKLFLLGHVVIRRGNSSLSRLYHATSNIGKPRSGKSQAQSSVICHPEEEFRFAGEQISGEKIAQRRERSVEDLLFDVFKGEDESVPMGKFLTALRSTGLRKSDPRLKELIDNMRAVDDFKSGKVSSAESLVLDRDTFNSVIMKNIILISRAFRGQFVIPDFTAFTKYIEEFYWKCKSNHAGKVASYIPQLARYNPEYWGVSLCTIDGQRFSIGDVCVPFTLQSCSKPISYAIALSELGADSVHKYIGQEPSGRNFNELVLDYSKKPHNPMINAGAIAVCSLILSLVKPSMSISDKFDFVASYMKRMCGYEFSGFSNATFLSERETGDRNYALGFYMREHKCFPDKANLKEVLDFYFQMCSMETNCESASVMAATLANGGICPITEEKVLDSHAVRDMLALMHSCGMYDYSGQFAFKIGLPAKSGVSGAMLVVVPNVMGICLWSPPLDTLGNSCRGLQFCEELVSVFNFHRYDNLKHTAKKQDPRRHKFETRGLQIVNLLFSAASGDVTALRRHKLSGMDMDTKFIDGRSALHVAAAEGHRECVAFLLEHCAVPHDTKDRWGRTALDDAITFGHQDVVDLLEEYNTQRRLQDCSAQKLLEDKVSDNVNVDDAKN